MTNKNTDWDKFRQTLDSFITLKVRLKTTDELESQSKILVEQIRAAAIQATPPAKEVMQNEVNYPSEISEEKREEFDNKPEI